MTSVEEFTPAQEAALESLIQSFGIKHGEIAISIKVYDGKWTEATVNPKRRVLRKTQNQSKIDNR